MTEEERWNKVRMIVREELESFAEKLAAHIGGKKVKLQFVNGKWTGLTDEQIEVWKSAYPAVQVEQEIAKAASWIVSNPQSAPKSNFSRFLNAWMDRVQNRAAIRSIPVDKKMLSTGEPLTCHYCDKRATGTVSGVPTCSVHVHDAMDGKKVA